MLSKHMARAALAVGLTTLTLAAQAAVDLTINVTPVTQPLYLNDTTSITVNLENQGTTGMGAAGEFEVTLPAEMHFTAVPANCTAGPAPVQAMTCSFAALASGAQSSQSFQAQADVLYPSSNNVPGNPYLYILAAITNDGAGAPGRSYQTGAFYIDPRPAAVAPVPTLETWGLGVLSLLIGAAAMRRRRRPA